jgi:hypothetical protein
MNPVFLLICLTFKIAYSSNHAVNSSKMISAENLRKTRLNRKEILTKNEIIVSEDSQKISRVIFVNFNSEFYLVF